MNTEILQRGYDDMEFRDLKKQYQTLKPEMDAAMIKVATDCNCISGVQVTELEEALAEYVGVKHCISCANGTDALSLAAIAWGWGPGDAVFVPDFTFFSSGEIVADEGATPIFVDVCEDTFNMDPVSLEEAIRVVLEEGKLTPRGVVAVDLFGQPANFNEIIPICKKYNLKLLEDGAQGFGGQIGDKMACSFGDIATTSFFPAKPLGCYGDGGAIFTDDDELAALMKSLRVHGKGSNKYDNVRIGMNSRLDTIQAAILQVKFKAFKNYEVTDVNKVADRYSELLKDVDVITPEVIPGFISSWAQYSILLKDANQRDGLQAFLKENGVPSMIYYPKPMHCQEAFDNFDVNKVSCDITADICNRILALPIHPYMKDEDQNKVVELIKCYIER